VKLTIRIIVYTLQSDAINQLDDREFRGDGLRIHRLPLLVILAADFLITGFSRKNVRFVRGRGASNAQTHSFEGDEWANPWGWWWGSACARCCTVLQLLAE
jgi:hypothetical protein